MTNPLTKGLRPVHPGAILRLDVLPAIGKSVPQMAHDIGISRQHLHDIVKERKPVTAETALRLGKYLGNGPEIWSALQCRYDLAMAEKRMAEELEAIPKAEAA